MSYNGWSNYETWLVNMWYGDILADMANEPIDEDVAIDGGMLREYVEQHIDEILPEKIGFVADIVNAALREVDWYELVEHYAPEREEEDA